MANAMTDREERRLVIQAELDAAKVQADRNRMGQFATPTGLALEILQYAMDKLGETQAVRFLDPAIGTGSFFSALLTVFPEGSVTGAVGYEVDRHYGEPAKQLWNDTVLDVRLEDFTLAKVPSDEDRFDLLVCNPPYVRHHHVDSMEKRRLKTLVWDACGIDMSGLAGLYCYFLGLSHRWMEEGGLAGWLMPSEFMDVNYGASVKRYLLDKVTLHHIHRFDPNEVQFGDALVSSSVVWFTKRVPPVNHNVRMSYGGSLLEPRAERSVSVETLRLEPKWTRYPMKETHTDVSVPTLGDFFDIKRGLATGNNRYFILSIEDIEKRGLPIEAFRPIMPSPRYLTEMEILADSAGNPVLEHRLFLLDCRLPEEDLRERFPTLGDYLDEGKARGIADRYLCSHRSPWYAQENRPAAPFLCTYLGRSDNKSGRAFRFILNHSLATAANVYLMLYPKGPLEKAIADSPDSKGRVWEYLNGIGSKVMLNEGRVYGGGLHKLEPKELGRVPAAALVDLLPEPLRQDESSQRELFKLSQV